MPSNGTIVCIELALLDNTSESSDDVAALYLYDLKKESTSLHPIRKPFPVTSAYTMRSGASGDRYLNDSTVGAGLPVINTLKELVGTDDKVSN